MMALAEMQHMRLEDSFLCADCHAVHNGSKSCPACASANVMSLANVLDRKQSDPFADVRVVWNEGWKP